MKKYKVVKKMYSWGYWSTVMDKWVGSVGESIFESDTWLVIRFENGYTYAFPREVVVYE